MTNKTTEKMPAHQLRDAASSGNLAELKKLIWEGVPVNDRSSFNNTALLHAAKHGKQDCVRFLIENGADVNIANNSGYTPLICSAIIGNYESVEMLLGAGAKTWYSLKEEDGSPRRVQQTALTLAERNKHFQVAELLKPAHRRRQRRPRRASLSQTLGSGISPGNTFNLTGSWIAASSIAEAVGTAITPKQYAITPSRYIFRNQEVSRNSIVILQNKIKKINS